jgi:heme/copper-type cytochrome/quinol oxidase subunit 4
LTVFVSQLALTAAAVAVSQSVSATRFRIVGVMLLAAVNGLVVALVMMNLRRDSRLVAVFAIVLAVCLAGLLAWPAWDVYERVRVF